LNSEPKKIKLTPTEARKKLENYCAYQERCHTEVREKLYGFGLYTREVDEIVAYLVTHNYLNEERFAEAYASGKFSIKHWGKNKIKAGLKLKRVSEYSIRKALASIDPDEYLKILRKVAEKKNNSLKLTGATTKNQKEYLRKSKLTSYLLSRGFEGDLIADTLAEIL